MGWGLRVLTRPGSGLHHHGWATSPTMLRHRHASVISRTRPQLGHTTQQAMWAATRRNHVCHHLSWSSPLPGRPEAMVWELGWCQVQLTSPEPAAPPASSPPLPRPPAGCKPRAWGIHPLQEWPKRGSRAELCHGDKWQSSSVARPCWESGVRHGSIPAELTAFRKPTSEGRSLCTAVLSVQRPVVGLLLAAVSVIGSSLAPLGACLLVSMATPPLSKQRGHLFMR